METRGASMSPDWNRLDRSVGVFGRQAPGSKGTDHDTPRLQLVALHGLGCGLRRIDSTGGELRFTAAQARARRRLRGRVHARSLGASPPAGAPRCPGMAGRRDGRWDAPPVRPAPRLGRRARRPDAGFGRGFPPRRTSPGAGRRPRGGAGDPITSPGELAQLRNLDRRALRPRNLVWWPQQWNPRPSCRSVGGSNR